MTLLGFERRDLRMLGNLFQMIVRDRYLGSALGMVWAITSPLLLLSIFTFVFGFVFQSRLPGSDTSLTFVIWLISGYGPWLAISEGLLTGTNAVTSNGGLLKSVPLKTELFPLAAVLTGAVPLVVSMTFLFILTILAGVRPNLSWLAMLPATVLLFTFIAGIALYLSATNVFVRDVGLVLPNILLIVLFASPIFYALEAFPQAAQPVLRFNPFFVLAELFRAPILKGEWPKLWHLAYLTVVSGAVFVFGLRYFRRLKSHFDAFL